MLLKKNGKMKKVLTLSVMLLGLIILGLFFLVMNKSPEPVSDVTKRTDPMVTGAIDTGTEIVVEKKIHVKPKIDYKDLSKDENLKNFIESRKEKLGLNKSLDLVVRSDETFTVGGHQIAMSDILKQAFLKKGQVFEEKIESSGEIRPQKIKEFGIYVIQPGDNIWNIHFNILKEYYQFKGITVSAKADEPLNLGRSSGVGKILKFSETMVIIYNLVDRKVDTNINLLQPLSKIVVYNMDEVFSLLQEVNYENIDRIQFDGQTIWIPTEKL